jgi:uncharacterized protein (TIGR02284 family)
MLRHASASDLVHLVAVKKNLEEGFLNAAKNIRNSEPTHRLRRQHARFANEIQQEIVKLGGNPPEHGTVSGEVRRGWVDLKSALTGNSAGAILSSCESGEDRALAAYDQAEADISSGHVFTILQKQWQQITSFSTRLQQLIGEVKEGVEFPKNE